MNRASIGNGQLTTLRLRESFGYATSLLEQLTREQTRLTEIVIPR